MIHLGMKRVGVAATAMMLVSCAALDNGGDTLGTAVVATGSAITLRWDPTHPLDMQMRSIPFRLQADYADTQGRKHSDTLATARPGGNREVVLPLPASLAGVPQGGVCLYLLPGGNREALPIRSVSAAAGSDTAGFRYMQWEPLVTNASAQQKLGRQAQQLDAEIAALTKLERTAAAVLTQQNVPTIDDCQKIPAATVIARPADVLDPSAHDVAARKVCVRRVRNLRLSSSVVESLDLPKLAQQEVASPSSSAARAAPDAYAQRLAQTRAFLADWHAHYESVGAAYVPEIGGGSDSLAIGVAVAEVRTKILTTVIEQQKQKGVQVTKEDLPGIAEVVFENLPPDLRYMLLAAGIEAYGTCLADTRMQLKSKYDAWQYAEQRMPERARQAHEYDMAQCRKGFTRHAELVTSLQEMNAQQQALQADFDLTRSAAPAALPTQEVLLNRRTCAP